MSDRQRYEDWLTDKLEEARRKYKSGPRSDNPRQTDIHLGRVRAFRAARAEYLDRVYNNSDPRGDGDE